MRFGFATTKKGEETIEQPTILKELGIGFTTALPMNARAKHIERAFRTIKEQFCKLFESYTGGTIIEKPDKLKIVVKDPKHMKMVAELKELIGTYLDGWYNKQPHSGEGMGGKSPDEVYYANLLCQRTATEDQLRLMLMRWSNPLTVGKNGVKFRIYGEELVYSSKDLWFNYFGKKVFVRYNPDDLNAVFIYDADGKFVCESALDTKLGYNANKDEIEKKQREKRGYRKTLIEYKKLQEIETHDELELIISEAMMNIALGGNQVSGITSINQIEGAGYSELKKVSGGFDFLGVHYDAEELPDYNGGIRRLESAVYGEGY
ncbi:hypothetical protein FACS1894188_13060 [Clostridia bacterium]|nr:hypothetical protein FACS1894188_13060 [Clostridia bacterium]